MKVIIAGSRDITNPIAILAAERDSGFSIAEVVCGMARGVDLLGKKWAEDRGIPVKCFPADWKTHGKAAGQIRNRQMGDYADALIAVWDGYSRGTKGMVDYMKSLGKPVHVHRTQ